MSHFSRTGSFLLGFALLVTSTGAASAQTVGTFQWTLQPFCNVVTATVSATETGYTLDGWDDQCGAPTKAPLVGQVSANPDGSLGLGFHVVTTPDAKAVSVIAIVSPTTRAGTWRDSEGHSGTFAVGALAGGAARPAPSTLVGAAAIDPAEVQRRVNGSCAAGEFFRGVNQDGTAVCAAPAGGGDITDVVAGAGLRGGATNGSAALAVDFTQVASADHDHWRPGHSLGLGGDNFVAGSPGQWNVAVGERAMRQNLTGSANVAIGAAALSNGAMGQDNVAVGASAMAWNNTSSNNVAVGRLAMFWHNTGDGNAAVGADAMSVYASGSENAAFGFQAGRAFNYSSRNVAIGAHALENSQYSDDNIAIGWSAAAQVVFGANNIHIGSGPGTDESDTIRLGATHTRAFIAGIRSVTTGANDAVPVVIDSNGQLGTVSSSARTKHDIADLPSDVSARLQQLRPVQFRYNQAFANGEQPLQYGLIAEEVQQVLPELVATGKDGTPETVKYHVLPALLLAEVQRLSREVAELRALLATERAKQ